MPHSDYSNSRLAAVWGALKDITTGNVKFEMPKGKTKVVGDPDWAHIMPQFIDPYGDRYKNKVIKTYYKNTAQQATTGVDNYSKIIKKTMNRDKAYRPPKYNPSMFNTPGGKPLPADLIEKTSSWPAFNKLFADAIQREKSAGFIKKILPAARNFVNKSQQTVQKATDKAKNLTKDDIINGLIGGGTAAGTTYLINKHILNSENSKPTIPLSFHKSNNAGDATAQVRSQATENDQQAQRVFEARTGGSLRDQWWRKWRKDFIPGNLRLQGSGEYPNEAMKPTNPDLLWGRMNGEHLLNRHI